MKQKKKGSEQKSPSKKRKRPKLTEEQKAAIKKYFDEHPVTYTIETVGEWIHPDVKAKLEAQKNKE